MLNRCIQYGKNSNFLRIIIILCCLRLLTAETAVIDLLKLNLKTKALTPDLMIYEGVLSAIGNIRAGTPWQFTNISIESKEESLNLTLKIDGYFALRSTKGKKKIYKKGIYKLVDATEENTTETRNVKAGQSMIKIVMCWVDEDKENISTSWGDLIFTSGTHKVTTTNVFGGEIECEWRETVNTK